MRPPANSYGATPASCRPEGSGQGSRQTGDSSGRSQPSPRIWDAETGREVSSLDYPIKALQVVFSLDGGSVVTRLEGAALTWDPMTGEVLTVMPGHGGVVTGALPSTDGRWIVTTADDGLTRVWNAMTGQLVATFDGAGGPGNFGVWAAGDRAVVSWSQGGVRVDRCEVCDTVDHLIELAGTRVTRTFHGRRASGAPRWGGCFAGSDRAARGPDGTRRRARARWPPRSGRIHDGGLEPPLSFTLGDGWQLTDSRYRGEEGEVRLATVIQLQQLETPSNGLTFSFLDPGARSTAGRTGTNATTPCRSRATSQRGSPSIRTSTRSRPNTCPWAASRRCRCRPG